MADASVLGIHPPATVRIDLGGWVQDWPWHCVDVYGDELVISVPLTGGRRRVVFYPYEHALQVAPTFPAPVWRFHGRDSFTVTAGPAQAAAMDTAGPAVAVT